MQQNNIKSDVVVHSVNPVGADNIKGVLPHAHLMPFGTFELIPTIEDGQLKSLKIQPMEAF